MKRYHLMAALLVSAIGFAAAANPTPATPAAASQPVPAALPTATSPATLTIAGAPVTLALPDGACAYDRNQPVDANVLGFLEKGNEGLNQVLLAFTDCGDLEAQRRGEPSSKGYYGQILSEYSKQALGASVSRPDYVRQMTQQFNSADAEKDLNTAKDRVKSALNEPVDLGESKMLGVINTDPDYVQLGMVQSAPADNGGVQKIDGVITITKLGVPVSINFYHTDDNPASWAALNTQAGVYAKKLVALNADHSLTHADARPETDGRQLALILGGILVAVGVIAAAFIHQRRRKPS